MCPHWAAEITAFANTSEWTCSVTLQFYAEGIFFLSVAPGAVTDEAGNGIVAATVVQYFIQETSCQTYPCAAAQTCDEHAYPAALGPAGRTCQHPHPPQALSLTRAGLDPPSTTTTTATATTTTATTTARTQHVHTSTAAKTTRVAGASSSNSAVIGGVVGGMAGGFLLLVLVVLVRRCGAQLPLTRCAQIILVLRRRRAAPPPKRHKPKPAPAPALEPAAGAAPTDDEVADALARQRSHERMTVVPPQSGPHVRRSLKSWRGKVETLPRAHGRSTDTSDRRRARSRATRWTSPRQPCRPRRWWDASA